LTLRAQPNLPENQKVEPEEEVNGNKKGHYILGSEVEKAIKVMRDQKATGDDDVLQLVSER
jgi:hypothetical protein